MSYAYAEFPVADRDPGSPIDQPFWDGWIARHSMHRQRPASRLPVSLTSLPVGPASGSTSTEIWVPPWALQYSAAFRVVAAGDVGFGQPAAITVGLRVGANAVERTFLMTPASPGVDEEVRLVVDLAQGDLDSAVTWRVSYELSAAVLSGASIETVVGSGRRLAQHWGTP